MGAGSTRRLESIGRTAINQRTSLDELWSDVRRGDASAFESLFDRLAPTVHGVCVGVLRDPAMAEETTQEALLQLWQQAPRHEPCVGGVQRWACMVAHRRAIDAVRTNQARRRRENKVCNDPTSDFSVSSTLESFDFDRWGGITVHDALGGLTAVQRQAIELAFFGDLTYRQVASTLGVPEGTIKARIRNGLSSLRVAMTTVHTGTSSGHVSDGTHPLMIE